jgi:hypothetical protein
VDEQFQARDSVLSALNTAEDWDLRAQTVRDSIRSWTGPFPKRTLLNARITGRLERKDYIEEDAKIEREENLWASNSGDIYSERGSRQPHDWVLDYLSKHHYREAVIKDRQDLEKHREYVARSIGELLNMDFSNIMVSGNFTGVSSWGELDVRKFVLKAEPGVVLPGVLFVPGQISKQDVILFIGRGDGKTGILEERDILTELLGKGYRVCAVDLRGTGETAPDMMGELWDFLAGKPLFGQRVMDILAVIKWLKESEIKANKISFVKTVQLLTVIKDG